MAEARNAALRPLQPSGVPLSPLQSRVPWSHPPLFGRKDVHFYNHLPCSHAQPASPRFAQAVPGSWYLLVPCRAVGLQPGWLHPSVPRGVCHSLGRYQLLPNPAQSRPFPVASGRFRFLPTRWAAPLIPLPLPKQQLGSQNCPVPAPRCHLPPCFRQQVGDLRARAGRNHVALGLKGPRLCA